MSMIPRKIYLRENELKDQFMCERMVSCDASIGSCNIEYTNLSQIWHDAGEEPRRNELLLGEDTDGFSIYRWCLQEDNWEAFVNETRLSRWAYIDNLLPKGGKK